LKACVTLAPVIISKRSINSSLSPVGHMNIVE
jgi:hypothetical protein